MSATSASIQLDPQAILDGIAKWGIQDFEAFVQKVNYLAAMRKTPSLLPMQEVDLIKKINDGVPLEAQRRYRELLEKKQDVTLSEQEHEEMGRLIPQLEAWDVERLNLLLELAQLRGVSVKKVMQQLQIKPPLYV